MDTSVDKGTSGADTQRSKQGLIALNDLTYVLEPDMSVAVNKTHKRHFFQSNTYTPEQRGICILNSGADYIDTRRSFLSFEVALTNGEGHGFFGSCGSACNLIENILISTRSGDELCRITDFGLLQNMLIPMTYCESWKQTTGQVMRLGGGLHDPAATIQSSKSGTVTRLLIPMYLMAPLFAYGRLLPAMLMSGMRIEITWASKDKAMQGHTPASGALKAAPNYTIKNLYFDLASVQLSDSIQRALNEQSATNGLEIVYTDYEKTEVNHGNMSTTFHAEVRKSCSRALKAFARVRCKSSTPDGLKDSFRAEQGFPVIEYQWQLGSLYFPQQPIKASAADKPFTAAAETYAHLLESCDKFHPGSKPPALTFRGNMYSDTSMGQAIEFGRPLADIPASTTVQKLGSGGAFANVVGFEDQPEAVKFSNMYADYGAIGSHTMGTTASRFGGVGSFAYDQHMIGVTLERSTMFNLAGVTVNNSRVLALRLKLAAKTSEFKGDGTSTPTVAYTAVDANARNAAGDIRSLSVYLKYVKLARVFLNNVEVEQ